MFFFSFMEIHMHQTGKFAMNKWSLQIDFYYIFCWLFILQTISKLLMDTEQKENKLVQSMLMKCCTKWIISLNFELHSSNH